MNVGVSLLNNWGFADLHVLVDLAVRAEALGIDSVWTHDHVFNVAHVRQRIGDRPYDEPLTLLSFVAARTERVKLGTSVLVLPYHNAIRLAKAAAISATTSDPDAARTAIEMVGREVVPAL